MTPPPAPSRPSGGFIARVFRWILGLAGALFAALMLNVIIEWAGLTFVWPEMGASRSQAVLRQDLAWLRGSSVEPISLPLVTVPAPSLIAADLSGRLYHWIFVWTGLEALISWLASTSAILAVYLEAALNSVQTYFVRLAITITAIPLFAIFAWWGMLEGLVRRDLRRFGVGIEHGMIYHWAKHLTGATLAVPVFLYLAWPGSINPAMLFVPFSLALGINVLVVSSTFTKYV